MVACNRWRAVVTIFWSLALKGHICVILWDETHVMMIPQVKLGLLGQREVKIGNDAWNQCGGTRHSHLPFTNSNVLPSIYYAKLQCVSGHLSLVRLPSIHYNFIILYFIYSRVKLMSPFNKGQKKKPHELTFFIPISFLQASGVQRLNSKDHRVEPTQV